jgi:type I restriction enzyme, S subunit
MAVWSEIPINALSPTARMDSEYYQPYYLNLIEQLNAVEAVPIESFATVTDGIHASPDWVEEDGVRYLSAKCVKDNFFALEGAGQISREQDAANPRTRARMNDVLITTVGTIGNAVVVNDEVLPANMDRHLGIIRIHPARRDVDPYYLSLFLNTYFGRAQSLRESTGNVQLNLFIESIKGLLVPLFDARDEIGEEVRQAYQLQARSKDIYAEAETLLLDALGLNNLSQTHPVTYEQNFQTVARAGRMDAQYYHPEKQEVLDALAPLSGQPISHHVHVVQEIADASDDFAPEVQNYDLTDALRFFLPDIEPMPTTELGSAKKRFQQGDVVVSRLRSYLKEIAVVEAQFPACVGSTEFIVLRPRPDSEVSPELLLVYLRSEPVQKILRWCQDGSQHPRFKEEELIQIKIPNRLLSVQSEVKAKIRAAIQSFYDAQTLLEEAKHRVEKLIEEGK